MTSRSEIDHPSFPQPENRTATIWRYMQGDRFFWLVQHRRLYMPRMTTYSDPSTGDPFEGSTPLGEHDWWQRMIDEAKTPEHRLIAEQNKAFLSRIKYNLRGQAFVSCWQMRDHEDFAMWPCFTKTSESVTIRTTYDTLRAALPDYVDLGLVRYIDYAKDRLPSNNVLDPLMHKRVGFQYEREVRALAVGHFLNEAESKHFRDSHLEREDKPGEFVYAPEVDVQNLIKGIVLHPNAPPEFVEMMTKYCAENGLPAPEPSGRKAQPRF